MTSKLMILVVLVSVASLASALKCYDCNIGSNELNHACTHPRNTTLTPEIKQEECLDGKDVCVTILFSNDIKRYCAFEILEGISVCDRNHGSEAPTSCNFCKGDLCNGDKSGGAATLKISALLLVFAVFLYKL